MGGKNHQPCGAYLQNSTRMSMSMSLAFMALERGNVFLEKMILTELDGKTGDVENITQALDESVQNLIAMRDDIKVLRAQMDSMDYTDLPTLSTMNLTLLGKSLAADATHQDYAAWTRASEVYERGGFSEMLMEFDSYIDQIEQDTKMLAEQISALQSKAETGEMHMVLEGNQEGNFRPTFARLYTTWALFQQIFLASSLISTESWYQFNNYGSLSSSSAHALKTA